MAVELVTMAMSKSGPRSNRGPPAALVSELLLSDWSVFDSSPLPAGNGGSDDGESRVMKATAASKARSPGCGKSWPVQGLDEICAVAKMVAASRDIAGAMIASLSPMKTKAGVASGAPGLRTKQAIRCVVLSVRAWYEMRGAPLCLAARTPSGPRVMRAASRSRRGAWANEATCATRARASVDPCQDPEVRARQVSGEESRQLKRRSRCVGQVRYGIRRAL
jgi:hypothetical protein